MALNRRFPRNDASLTFDPAVEILCCPDIDLRLAGGLITFLIQVRFLGPHQFGVIGSAITVAALASLVSDFGMNTYAMRWGSAKPERRDGLISLAVIVKAFLSVMFLLPCLVWVHLLGLSAHDERAATLTIIGYFAAATADIGLIALRVRSLFDREMIIVAWTTFVSVALVVVAATVTRDVLPTAFFFAVGRVLYLVAALHAIRETLAGFRTTARGIFRDGLALLVASKVYAVDLILSNAGNQIDVVIMAFFVDTASVGRYVVVTRLCRTPCRSWACWRRSICRRWPVSIRAERWTTTGPWRSA